MTKHITQGTARRLYWIIRFVVGVGPWVLLLVLLLLTNGANAFSGLHEPITWIDLGAMIFVFIFVVFWNSIIAAGIAGYLVYGSFRVGIFGPPLNYREVNGVFR